MEVLKFKCALIMLVLIVGAVALVHSSYRT